MSTKLRNVACKVLVLQIGRDDRQIVGPVPGPGGGCLNELEGGLGSCGAGSPRSAERQRRCLARIFQEGVVDGPPPWTTRCLIGCRVQQASPNLPRHERRRRSPEGQISLVNTCGNLVQLTQEREPGMRMVNDAGYPLVRVAAGRIRHATNCPTQLATSPSAGPGPAATTSTTRCGRASVRRHPVTGREGPSCAGSRFAASTFWRWSLSAALLVRRCFDPQSPDRILVANIT